MFIEETKKDHSGKIIGNSYVFKDIKAEKSKHYCHDNRSYVMLNMFQVRCVAYLQPQHSEVEDSQFLVSLSYIVKLCL